MSSTFTRSTGGGGSNSSGSSSSNPSLSDIAPWSIHRPDTILVGDSISSDGRFVLYTLAEQIVSSSIHQPKQKLLWFGCTATTEEQIAYGMKKIGCNDVAVSNYIIQRNQLSIQQQQQSMVDDTNKNSTTLIIRSIPSLINKILIESNKNDDDELNEEKFVRNEIYNYAKTWLAVASSTNSENTIQVPSWIIFDDISALANLIGDRLCYMLIHTLRSLSNDNNTSKNYNFGLAIRYSMDYDITSCKVRDNPSLGYSDWFGAGGRQRSVYNNDDDNTNNDTIPWERSLLDFADLLVDVIPLATGISREVHGRILFTKPYDDAQTMVYNYSLTDNKVITIRIT